MYTDVPRLIKKALSPANYNIGGPGNLPEFLFGAHGYKHAPKGHKSEGTLRGSMKGTGTAIGAGLGAVGGGVGGAGLGLLISELAAKAQGAPSGEYAPLGVGAGAGLGGLAGLIGGGFAGHGLTNSYLGKPTWEDEDVHTDPTREKKSNELGGSYGSSSTAPTSPSTGMSGTSGPSMPSMPSVGGGMGMAGLGSSTLPSAPISGPMPSTASSIAGPTSMPPPASGIPNPLTNINTNKIASSALLGSHYGKLAARLTYSSR